ncbi:MAG: O-antigen ligase family protein [bacterium]|nr:O-antigen ligase family protein [bacterium]
MHSKESNDKISLLIYAVSLVALFLVIFGLVPRPVIFLPAALITGFLLRAPLKDGALFFIRFIPFFFALPLTARFDNFNLWRIAIIILFVKWLLAERRVPDARGEVLRAGVFVSLRQALGRSWRSARAELLGASLLAFGLLSLLAAQDLTAGLRRVIYFANMALLFIIVRDLVRREPGFFHAVAHNFFISGIAVVALGFMQWFVAYIISASTFHYWWGQMVSLGMYGSQWANIATNFGNTWFSYSGGGLRLRMFSIFPDSHSFPLYLLTVLPFLFALLFDRSLRTLWNRRSLWLSFFAMHLAMILSGTRGIWAGALAPALALAVSWRPMPLLRPHVNKLLLSLAAFALMFPLAWGLILLPQFHEEATTPSRDVFLSRLTSLIDTQETSNSGRIAIWKKTLQSIAKYPLLGVGIGNYPLVLNQDIAAAKAGSSAHNLFLHLAAEMGIAALAVFLWFIYEIMRRAVRELHRVARPEYAGLFLAAALFSLVWILAYSLTDPAIFDERAFLGFMVLLGTVLGITRAGQK